LQANTKHAARAALVTVALMGSVAALAWPRVEITRPDYASGSYEAQLRELAERVTTLDALLADPQFNPSRRQAEDLDARTRERCQQIATELRGYLFGTLLSGRGSETLDAPPTIPPTLFSHAWMTTAAPGWAAGLGDAYTGPGRTATVGQLTKWEPQGVDAFQADCARRMRACLAD